jgi:hypothetical protein
LADAPINLNRARKVRARVKKARQADENAVKFGRTKSERTRDMAQADLMRARHAAHRRDDPPEDGNDP